MAFISSPLFHYSVDTVVTISLFHHQFYTAQHEMFFKKSEPWGCVCTLINTQWVIEFPQTFRTNPWKLRIYLYKIPTLISHINVDSVIVLNCVSQALVILIKVILQKMRRIWCFMPSCLSFSIYDQSYSFYGTRQVKFWAFCLYINIAIGLRHCFKISRCLRAD
jgi:hypothetical protein